MEEKPTKTASFLSSLLPEIKTEVGFNAPQLIQAGAIVFIVAVAIIFSWFAIKKVVK